MRKAIQEPTRRSWPNLVLVAVASSLLLPAVTFALCLTYTGDAWSSLGDALVILPGSVLAPFVLFCLVQGTAAQIRYGQGWASLPIH